MREEDNFEIRHKWAFGMAQPKPMMVQRRLKAVQETYSCLFLGKISDASLDAISETKGLFTRVFKQDQWDWFTVCGQLGHPSARICNVISSALASFRSDVVSEIPPFDSTHGEALRRLPVRKCLKVFLGQATIRDELNAGWLYYLSNRENPDIAKIGMTNRTIEERVREINAATGVLHPYGVRSCWRVSNPSQSERIVHEALAEYRIRRDREFFRIGFHVGRPLIQKIIAASGYELRTLDNLSGLLE